MTEPSLSLLCKLGSLAVHIDELLSDEGDEVFDRAALDSLLSDSEVTEWIAEMQEAALVPQKR